ncbi:MAG: GNAT family N-acetyltransferase [Gemmatirosa sp.]|nr:GNAT family N-acetyltransferase [Gemmatirosa sp.]
MSPSSTPRVRLATHDDLPALRALIDRSVRGLSADVYDARQIDSALVHVFGPDTRLIDDGTYYVIVDDGGALLAGGGWSRRRTLFGGDQMKGVEDPLLDPATEPARIRAFFVDPSAARRGLGRRLLETCRDAAAAAGFRSLALAATLPGVPLYAALGFVEVERFVQVMPDGVGLPLVRMTRGIA